MSLSLLYSHKFWYSRLYLSKNKRRNLISNILTLIMGGLFCQVPSHLSDWYLNSSMKQGVWRFKISWLLDQKLISIYSFHGNKLLFNKYVCFFSRSWITDTWPSEHWTRFATKFSDNIMQNKFFCRILLENCRKRKTELQIIRHSFFSLNQGIFLGWNQQPDIKNISMK